MSWLRKLLLWKAASGQPVRHQDPVEAAKDNLLNKAGKLELGLQAVFLRQFQQLADMEVRDAERLKAKHLGPEFAVSDKVASNEEEVGNIVVGDDIHFHQPPERRDPQPSRAWPMAAGIALAGALIGGMVSLPAWLDRMKQPQPVPQPVPVQPQPEPVKPAVGGTITTIKRGFIIDLPGAKKSE